MAYSRREVALVVVIAVLACTSSVAQAAVSCGTVQRNLLPCAGYLVRTAPVPSGGCCGGVRSLYAATKPSRPDRITACNCIKALAKQLGSSLDAGRVSSLPGSCGVNLGYSISLGTNCNTIP